MLKIDYQFSVTNKIKFFCGMIGQESINDIIPHIKESIVNMLL
jgi:hypothetical protein